MKRILVFGGFFIFTALAAITFLGKVESQENRLPQNDEFSQSMFIGDVQVKVKKKKSGKVELFNAPDFETPSDIEKYVTKARLRLEGLAQASSTRQIEVAISPAKKLTLTDFGEFINRYGVKLGELSVDVFVNNKWDRMISFDDTTSLIDLSSDAQTISDRLIEIESNQEWKPLPRKGVTIALRYARGTMEAASAVSLQKEPAILSVDPVSDILDALLYQAEKVEVSKMPHLYVDRELRFGSLYRLENTTKAIDKNDEKPGIDQ